MSEKVKPNWEAIKAEYVSTDISLRALAEKHGIGKSTLMGHCSREKWTELREKAKSKAEAKLVRRAADQRARMMELGQSIGYDLLGHVKRISDRTAKVKMAATKSRSETDTEKMDRKTGKTIPVHMVSETDLSRLQTMYSGIMHTLGFDEASQIARERLNIDRLRVELHIEPDAEIDDRPVIFDARPDSEDRDAE